MEVSTRFAVHRLVSLPLLSPLSSLPLALSHPLLCSSHSATSLRLRLAVHPRSLSCRPTAAAEGVVMAPAAAVQELEDVGVGSVRQQVVNLVREALAATVPDVEGIVPQVAQCGNPRNGDYQW